MELRGLDVSLSSAVATGYRRDPPENSMVKRNDPGNAMCCGPRYEIAKILTHWSRCGLQGLFIPDPNNRGVQGCNMRRNQDSSKDVPFVFRRWEQAEMQPKSVSIRLEHIFEGRPREALKPSELR